MRIKCPICGERDRREYYYKGDAIALNRPAPDAGETAWQDYVHLRDNPAGRTRDLWQHEGGCGAWVVVTRDTVTHEIFEVVLGAEAAR
ncbi:sarcosine oxidase subunit delta [Sulfitobacter sp. SK012]|uniref:sarcosine oxidase subunit delta n=1 Tax=Sulfitobacter sp. SK012 TaxID=1389005 RepID=UPI000E0A21F1|nr:sarcosine oxidase subunit delta [Sulfitobacter sp. SK012]AXI45944.1 sarcosine oxidase subunit delta [Sulfitobacter sp. SK012]